MPDKPSTPMPFRLSSVLGRRLLALLLLCNVVLLVLFITFDYQLIFHSDAAAKNLLAQEIHDTGSYFPKDWNYINNDLWVFYTHTFIVPLLSFMRNGFAAHAVSDLVTAALILWSSWKVTGMLGQSPVARLLSMCLITCGMSEIMAEHIYGQAAYGSMYYMGCFLLYAYWSLVHAQQRARLGWGAATIVLAALVFWANPQRAVVFYGAPLLLAAAALLAMDVKAAPGAVRATATRHARFAALLMAGIVVGVALNSYTLRHVINHRGLTQMNWLTYDAMVHNAQSIFGGLMGILGGLPRQSAAVASPEGAYQLLRLLAALALLLLAPAALWRAAQQQHRGRMFVAVYTLAALAINLLIMLTTTLADMTSPEASVRYLVPPLLLMVMVFAGETLERPAPKLAGRAAALGCVAVLATSAAPSFLSPYYQLFDSAPAQLMLPTPDQRMIEFLRNNGLKYGYASFWNAGKLTVLSGHDIKVRQVLIENGLPVPMRNLSSNRWFRPEAWQGETFMLLRPAELKLLDTERMAAELGQPVRTLRYEDWTVLVYGVNVARLASWDLLIRQPLNFQARAGSPHNVGRYDAGAGALVAEAGETGTLHFGPFIGVEAGSYQVSFDVETAASAAGEFGYIDVVSGAGSTVHARLPLTATGRQHLQLPFNAAQATKLMEFRVFTNGTGRVLVRNVSIVRAAAAPT